LPGVFDMGAEPVFFGAENEEGHSAVLLMGQQRPFGHRQ